MTEDGTKTMACSSPASARATLTARTRLASESTVIYRSSRSWGHRLSCSPAR